MHKIITIHSFRQSVGKSTLIANLAASLALQGLRVGLVDTDFQGASTHLFYGLKDNQIQATFNDYILEKCDILQAVHDVSPQLGQPTNSGRLYLIPASTQVADIMHMLRTRLNIERYTEGLNRFEKEMGLDILLVDTHAGLNENTLTAIAVSTTLILVLHPDQQDFQGTAVTVEIARKLLVPTIQLILNDSSESLDTAEVSRQLEQTYHCTGGYTLSHSEELLALASSRPFVLAYPEHPLTKRIQTLATNLQR